MSLGSPARLYAEPIKRLRTVAKVANLAVATHRIHTSVSSSLNLSICGLATATFATAATCGIAFVGTRRQASEPSPSGGQRLSGTDGVSRDD